MLQGLIHTLRRWEVARLRRHFAQVDQVLRGRDVRDLSPQQQAARERHLTVLRTYAERGVFPHNPHTVQQPRFIDDAGRVCAVAHLLIEDGRATLAEQIRLNFNDAYIPEMQSPALEDWIAESGFTRAEVTRIQPSYMGNLEPYTYLYNSVVSVGLAQQFAMFLTMIGSLIGAWNLARLRRQRNGWIAPMLGVLLSVLTLLLTANSVAHVLHQLTTWEIRAEARAVLNREFDLRVRSDCSESEYQYRYCQTLENALYSDPVLNIYNDPLPFSVIVGSVTPISAWVLLVSLKRWRLYFAQKRQPQHPPPQPQSASEAA
jgi:hypothetical protein